MEKLIQYSNGNSLICIYKDGTRIIETKEDSFIFEYPLNIDIKVSTKCSFGLNPVTQKAFCSFCHESATTNGKECDYGILKTKLSDLPSGCELAIGCNKLTDQLYELIIWCRERGYIVNLTVNQGHINRDKKKLQSLIEERNIQGLGISYRSKLNWEIPSFFTEYKNTVIHVILGIDKYKDIKNLKHKGIKKILILGEKDFGLNKNQVNLDNRTHKEWFWWIPELFKTFEVVSFDNLAIEQLQLKRLFTEEEWQKFYQGEPSIYIDAVKEMYAPSSRSNKLTSWNNLSIKKYFKSLEGHNTIA
jgi:hypothetical protein